MTPRPYSVSVRPVISVDVAAAKPDAPLPRTVEVTTACAPIAAAITARLRQKGVAARSVASPTGQADCVILTDGYAPVAIATRHWNALAACRCAKGRRILMLQPAVTADLSRTNGLEGLSRTLNAEWPDTQAQCLTLHSDAPEIIADRVEGALKLPQIPALTSTVNGFTTSATGPDLTPPSRQQTVQLTWLVTGGGRGVTAACALALAQRSGGTFLLAGRSALIDWPDDIPQTDSHTELIGLLARHRTGSSPAQLSFIANRLRASQEVRQTLEAIRATGSEANYVPLDIADPQSVSGVLLSLQARHGPIGGLIHGAGVLSDRRADDKTSADFETVFAPKVAGLLNLLATLDLSDLSHIGVFSSASALFGNPGQADYAAANKILGEISSFLAGEHPHLHLRSFAWGPWDGGMVNASLAARFKARGIPLIPKQEGARIFADHMLSCDPYPVQICIGNDWTV